MAIRERGALVNDAAGRFVRRKLCDRVVAGGVIRLDEDDARLT